MIETTSPSKVVQELPSPDPEFRVEPQAQLPFIVPSSIEVFRVNDATEVQWSAPSTPTASEEAEGTLEKIVAASKREAERHPRSARARVNFGLALLNAGMLDAAADEFELARRLDPNGVSALAHLVRVRLLQQRVAEARELAQLIRQLDPSNTLGPLLVASVEMMAQQPEEATEALKAAARLAPRSWMPEYLLGLVLIGRQQVRDAIRHLRAAARSQPRSATVQHALGVALGLQGEWRKAVRAFREALVLAPKRRESVLALAHVLLRRGITDEAISLLSEWVAAMPHDREVQELLAQAYRVVGSPRSARRHLQLALQSMPADGEHAVDRARILNNVGVCVGTLGHHEEAADWYSRSIQANPTAVAFLNLAKAYRELGNLELARKVVATSLEENPNDSDAKLLSSVVAGELGYADEAVETLRQLISAGDAVAEAYAGLGWLLSDEKRDHSEALRVLSEGRERFPADSSIANNLAYVNLMLGNVDQARNVLASVPEAEIQESVYLTATVGLLRLAEGDVQSAASLYNAAEKLAKRQGSRVLSKTVRQKMHLEFARAYLKMGNAVEAQEHAKRGLAIEARRSYRDDLREIRGRLLPP